MRRQQNNKKPTITKVSTSNKYHKKIGVMDWRKDLAEHLKKTDSIRIKLKTALNRAQEILEANPDVIAKLERSEGLNPITTHINIIVLERNTDELQTIYESFASLVNEIEKLEIAIDAQYIAVQIFKGGEDPAYERYKQKIEERIPRYQVNMQTILAEIWKCQTAIIKFSSLKEECMKTIKDNEEKKLRADEKHEDEALLFQQEIHEREHNISIIKQRIKKNSKSLNRELFF